MVRHITLHNVSAVNRGGCSIQGDIQYTEGYHECSGGHHEYTGGIPWVHWGHNMIIILRNHLANQQNSNEPKLLRRKCDGTFSKIKLVCAFRTEAEDRTKLSKWLFYGKERLNKIFCSIP